MGSEGHKRRAHRPARAEARINNLAFSPDGAWLATGSEDGTTRLWDLKDTNTEPIVLRGHEAHIYTVAFSPDGAWLATGSDDAARLWDLKDTNAEPIVLRGHEASITTLAFSPDGAWLATGSDDTTVRLWDLNPVHLLVKACQVVGRNFTRAEWARYFINEDYRKTCEQWPLEPEVAATPTVSP